MLRCCILIIYFEIACVIKYLTNIYQLVKLIKVNLMCQLKLLSSFFKYLKRHYNTICSHYNKDGLSKLNKSKINAREEVFI